MVKQKLIDSHSHIFSEDFDQDRTEVLNAAHSEGVIALIESAIDMETALKALRNIGTIDTKLKIFISIGFNPCELNRDVLQSHIEVIKTNIDRIVAIGEVGLDFFYIKEAVSRETQKCYFKKFIELSKENNLPLIIHSRSAGKYAIDVLIKNKAEKVLMHAFDGSFNSAKKGLDHGYYFSIPPSVLHSTQKRKLTSKLPVEQILLETDSPALSPVRGLRNEPKNLLLSLYEVSKIKGLEPAEVAELTYRNTKRLFNLKNI